MSKILLLDVMGTLVTEPFMEVLPKFFNMSLQELFKKKHPSSWPQFERQEITEEQYFTDFFKDESPELDGQALKRAMYDHYQLIDGIEELLSELAAKEIPMYALSNYPSWYLMIEEKLKLSRWLEWKFVSWDTGVRKPDPNAYFGPAKTLGVSTKRCVFVDDRTINCDAAQATGMTAIKFVSAAQLRTDLFEQELL